MGKTVRYLIIFISVLLLIGTLIPIGAVGINPQESKHEINGNTNTHSSVEYPTLESTEEPIEVVVRLTERNKTIVTASDDPVSSLHDQAASTQEPLLRYAETREGIEVIKQFWITNAVLIEIDQTKVSLRSVEAVSGVERIHANFEVTTTHTTYPTSGTPSPTAEPQQLVDTTSTSHTYGLEQISVPQAWAEFETKGEGTTVAVLDSGVDIDNHPDIGLRSDGWIDIINDKSTPYDDNGHGTHVSGTIGGEQTTAGVHYGVAPNTDLLHAKVTNASGSGNFSEIIAGMEWAVEHNADTDVITMSLGIEGYYTDFIDPIQNAREAGVTVVAASGNSGAGSSASPGNIVESIGVGASTEDASIASFSSGETVDTAEDWGADAPAHWPEEYIVPTVAAPGVSVASAATGGGYTTASGTSMATPHVAGAVALIQSATDNSHSPEEIETALTNSAWKPDSETTSTDTRYGNGIIDTYAAIAYLEGETLESELLLVDVSMNPDTILEGESTTITPTVENTGSATGTFTADLLIDGDHTVSDSISVSPNAIETITFEPTFSNRGSYSISVNEQNVDELQVEKPATFEIKSTSPIPRSITVNEKINASVTVENVGDRTGSFETSIGIDGTVIQTKSHTIKSGETKTISFDHMFEETGEYTVSINDVTAGTVTVEPEPMFVISNGTVEPVEIVENESVTVSADVSNVAAHEEVFVGELQINNEIVETQSHLITAGNTTQISFKPSFEQSGSYTIDINDQEIGTVEVIKSKTSKLKRFDQSNTGEISFKDVIQAINSYNKQEKIGGENVSFSDVINVINAYNQKVQL